MTVKSEEIIDALAEGRLDLGARMRYRGEGNGSVYGPNAEVLNSTFGRNCITFGDSVIYDSRVYERTIIDTSIVRSSWLSDSYVSRSTLVEAALNGSEVSRSRILTGSQLSEINYSRLTRCDVYGQTKISKVDLDQVTVYRDDDGSIQPAVLIGPWQLWAPVRIHRGVWRYPPEHAQVGDAKLDDAAPGVRVTISECTDDHYHIGCFCKTYEEWTRADYRQRLGKYAGWSTSEIEFAFDCFTDWRRIRSEA